MWRPVVVEREVARESAALNRAWRRARQAGAPKPDAAKPPDSSSLEESFDRILRRCLIDLYPGVERFLAP